jgi:hypothetical protein
MKPSGSQYEIVAPASFARKGISRQQQTKMERKVFRAGFFINASEKVGEAQIDFFILFMRLMQSKRHRYVSPLGQFCEGGIELALLAVSHGAKVPLMKGNGSSAARVGWPIFPDGKMGRSG